MFPFTVNPGQCKMTKCSELQPGQLFQWPALGPSLCVVGLGSTDHLEYACFEGDGAFKIHGVAKSKVANSDVVAYGRPEYRLRVKSSPARAVEIKHVNSYAKFVAITPGGLQLVCRIESDGWKEDCLLSLDSWAITTERIQFAQFCFIGDWELLADFGDKEQRVVATFTAA